MAGTLLKTRLVRYRLLVNGGGACIGLAMVLLLFAVRRSPASWTLAAFIALAAVILVSMPAGLVLSARRHRPEKH
jgi:4-amino-4-deoxy-L-arabinose transferase-like glycosyltransferase